MARVRRGPGRLLVAGLLLGSPVPARGQVASPPDSPLAEAPFDLLLTGGRIIDGTGNPWYRADVGIRDGRIAAIGDLAGAPAARRLALGDRLLVPGFVDLHSHADEGLDAEGEPGTEGARRRAAPNLVTQGITTVVVNQDGRSPWPIGEQRSRLARLGIGPNAALMVGHNSLRALALGDDARRAATAEEIERMRGMVRRAMEEGAFGLSAGLEYVPGRWSETEELVPLVEEAGAHGGVYIVHERSSGLTPMWFWPSRDAPGPPTMIGTILEDIEIAERTGVTTVATHIKARGADFWGAGRILVGLIDRARDRGVPIWADHYPYDTTGSDGATVLLPAWLIEETARRAREEEREPDFTVALREALADPERAGAVRRDVAHEIVRRGGAERIVVFEHPDSTRIGRDLADLAAEAEVDPVEMALRLQLQGSAGRPGGARLRGFSLSEADVETFAARPWVATASDAGIALPGDGPVHARYYGTFPRKLRRYAMEREVLGLEDAIRSATSLPAQILGLRDRGQVREGFRADLAVLDPERLADHATFFEPHRYAEGVDLVWVDGRAVVEDGEPTWALPGRILTPSDGPQGAEPTAAGGEEGAGSR